jgi:hypothetical protein
MNVRSDFRRGLQLHAAAIDRIPTNLKGALAAACAQRQAEVYRTYAARTRDGSPKGFDDLLNAIWDDIVFKQASEQEHRKWDDRADNLYPNQKTMIDRFKVGAELAVLSILYSNDVLMTGKTQDTIDSAHQTFGSIRQFLTSSLGQTPQFKLFQPGTYEKVLEHPLTEAEHRRQERDLSEIEQALLRPDTIPGVVDGLRKRAQTDAKIFLPVDGQTAA